MAQSLTAVDEIVDYGGYPIDRTALRVILPGVHWHPNRKENRNTPLFSEPPPLQSTRRDNPAETRTKNLTGIRFARFIVIGYFGRGVKDGAAGQRWVVRCLCGNYTIRTAKTILRSKDPEDCCDACRHLRFLQQTDRKRQLKILP